VKGRKILGFKPLILREGNPLKHKHFYLNNFMQGIDEERLEKIVATSNLFVSSFFWISININLAYSFHYDIYDNVYA